MIDVLITISHDRPCVIPKYITSYDDIGVRDGRTSAQTNWLKYSWRDEKEFYPLRPPEKEINNLRAETIIKLLITTNLTQKSIGQEVGWNRSAVTMINTGKNHFNEKIVYPIRENKEKNKELLNL